MKKILVTGGRGFLGSHLCDRLVELGYEVICLDNFSTGSRTPLNPKIQFIEHDVCRPIKTEVDEIYNLACPASPIHYQSDPVQTLKTNVLGALNMLDLAKACGAKILQASTSEVYGDPLEHPQREEYWGHVNPIGYRSCYDEGKRCAETLFFDYHRQYGMPIALARIFNTYGPRMHPNDGRVVSNFIVQALQNKPLTIYGDGTQTRSFCYVSDLIEGLISLMHSPCTGPINLGNPTEFRIIDLAKQVIALTDSSSPLHFLPLPSDDPRQRKPDISLASQALKWSPKVSLTDGLKATISYFSAARAIS